MSGTPKADAPATARTRYEAGRELDAEVAEKVMGWHWYAPEFVYQGYVGYADLLAPKSNQVRGRIIMAANDPRLEGMEMGNFAPHYSTDIAAAWLVVEKMAEIAFLRLEVDGCPSAGFDRSAWCSFGGIGQRGIMVEARADTVPLAICLAALAALAPSVSERVVAPSRKDQGAQA